jgi:protein involved in polysaccharide export with SLBB domain
MNKWRHFILAGFICLLADSHSWSNELEQAEIIDNNYTVKKSDTMLPQSDENYIQTFEGAANQTTNIPFAVPGSRDADATKLSTIPLKSLSSRDKEDMLNKRRNKDKSEDLLNKSGDKDKREDGAIKSRHEMPSPLEKSFSAENITLQDKMEEDLFKRELKQFGYDFFRNTLLTGAPVENLPVGSDYRIGPGDSLVIDLWGSTNARYEVEVDRNGEINIPRTGTVRVWGLSYGEAKQVINKAIAHYLKGYELNVTLGRLRTIQVFVVGEVEAPGLYRTSSLGTVINALSLAGGPSRNGSLRQVRLIRGGSTDKQIDLYDFLLSGDRSGDVRLENGDTLFVPVIGPVVAVAGEVKRPAIYELKGKTTLPQIMEMAGGITAAGYTGRMQIERFEGNSARIVLDTVLVPDTKDALSAIEIHDRDMVKVFSVNRALRKVVVLEGNVFRPGEYQMREGMRISDLIGGYEALLPETFMGSAEIVRLAPPDNHREFMSFNLGKALGGDPRENILLQEQDTVRIYARKAKEEKRTVTIAGEVLTPGSFEYYDQMTVRDLVTASGSPKNNAYLENAELTRISVEVGRARTIRMELDLGKALKGDAEHNLLLKPNDALIVRGIPDWLESTDRFVTLRGEVRFPGRYAIAKGERLSSVIERAGGYTERAFLKGARFSRLSVRELQQKRMDEVIARTEQDVLSKQGELASLASSKEELEATKAALDGLLKSLEKLKTVKAEGRVVIRLASLDQFRNSTYDVELMGGDLLDVPRDPGVVTVMGQVYNPTTIFHLPRKGADYYLKKAGGPMRDAEKDDIYIMKADGSVISRNQSSLGASWDDGASRWNLGGFMSSPLDPGDTLVVPQKLDRIAWMREIKDMTMILGQLALTAGVLVAAL